jgi:hypothetical protein
MKIEHSHDRARHFTTDPALTNALAEIKRLKKEIESLRAEIEPSSCDVKGCYDEVSSGGSGWPETGYWELCWRHTEAFRKGATQPEMKAEAVLKESFRDPVTGYLPPNVDELVANARDAGKVEG